MDTAPTPSTATGGSDRAPSGTPLETVRRRRAGLKAAMVELEHAAAAPVPGREHTWRIEVRRRAELVQRRFASHIAGTEGDEGLYADVLAASARQAHAINVLRAEHEQIADAIRDLLDALATAGDGGADALATAREQVTNLLARLSRHRQRGSDLIFVAYQLDIGGET
jgi:Hemerythrin HHE cation binding domain